MAENDDLIEKFNKLNDVVMSLQIRMKLVEDTLKEFGSLTDNSEVAVFYEEEDDLVPKAARLILEEGKASASLLQRKLSIGYARAARILDQLEILGLVGESDGDKPRDINREMIREYLAEVGEDN